MTEKIPVTIVSGFLGAGKTTLINKVLKEPHNEHIAVIINEFGETGVDHQFVLDVEEEIYQMDNGCLCCTLRSDIADMLKSILTVKEKNGIQVDRILFETTGLADPSPIAHTFINVPFLNEHFILDAVLTVVDAKHFQYEAEHQEEPAKQVAFADKLFISKRSLVDEHTYQQVLADVRSINAFAPIQDLDEKAVSLSDMFDLQLFYATESKILEMEQQAHAEHVHTCHECDCECGHDHDCSKEGCECSHHHTYHGCHEHEHVHTCHECGCECDHDHDCSKEDCECSHHHTCHECHKHEHVHTCHECECECDHDHDCSKEDCECSHHHTCLECHEHEHVHTCHECECECDHDHDCSKEDCECSHHHTCHAHHHVAIQPHHSGINSFVIEATKPLQLERINEWLSELVYTYGQELYRYKGILYVEGIDYQVIFQGVQMSFDISRGRDWTGTDHKKSTLVFIGKQLPEEDLRSSFAACAE